MRRGVRIMGLAMFGVVLLLGVVMAYVRLAPSDAARWDQLPDLYAWGQGGAFDSVVPMDGGASLRLSLGKGQPPAVLARLDRVAMATPRTDRLAGTVAEGRITWVTRSRLWGFPDYTTAEVRPDGVYIYARQRFGSRDMGVNAARLEGWLASL